MVIALIVSVGISCLIIEYKVGVVGKLPFLKKVFGSPHA